MKTKSNSNPEIQTPELLIIGAGPAGLSAAIEAKRCGVEHVLVVDREKEPGGILNQCIHAGFGLFHYGAELTGPEYAQRLTAEADAAGVALMTETFVAALDDKRYVTLFSKHFGYAKLRPRAVVLAMGCRERTRAAVAVPGTRPAGVYTAGTAQRLINVEGYTLGKRAVIVGSGDIGLIMARRLILEGVEVAGVIEIREMPAGLPRNVSQCLNAFSIPLFLSHRVVAIEGTSRVTGVVTEPVNGGAAKRISCDLVLFSVGLIPENELSAMAGIRTLGRTNGLELSGQMETEASGIFACGNAYRVYDLVDEVSREAALAGRGAAAFLGCREKMVNKSGNPYLVRSWTRDPDQRPEPNAVTVSSEDMVEDMIENTGGDTGEDTCEGAGAQTDQRTSQRSITCIICPKGCVITSDHKGKLYGYGCRRGLEFAIQELRNPSAVLTTTVAIEGALWPRLPCKTTGPVPRNRLMEAAMMLSGLEVKAPVAMGEVLMRNIFGMGVDVVATRAMALLENV